MRSSDWGSDVCSSDLTTVDAAGVRPVRRLRQRLAGAADVVPTAAATPRARPDRAGFVPAAPTGSRTRLRQLDRRSVADAREDLDCGAARPAIRSRAGRSEEPTSELQSLMRISYAVFCLKKKNIQTTT